MASGIRARPLPATTGQFFDGIPNVSEAGSIPVLEEKVLAGVLHGTLPRYRRSARCGDAAMRLGPVRGQTMTVPMKVFRGKLLCAKKFPPGPLQETPEHWLVLTMREVLEQWGADFHPSLWPRAMIV